MIPSSRPSASSQRLGVGAAIVTGFLCDRLSVYFHGTSLACCALEDKTALLSLVSASAKRRGITPQLFAAWGRTQERAVAACPTRPRLVSDSVVYRRQRFKFDTATGCFAEQ